MLLLVLTRSSPKFCGRNLGEHMKRIALFVVILAASIAQCQRPIKVISRPTIMVVDSTQDIDGANYYWAVVHTLGGDSHLIGCQTTEVFVESDARSGQTCMELREGGHYSYS